MTAATPAQLNAAAEIEALDNPGITKFYLAVRREFRELLKRARRISRGSGGISSTGNRMYWGCVLFTRIVVTAKSLDQLLPDPKPGEHWDFSAAASLTRNLFEACLVYHWLCGEDVPETLREARFILFHLHDHGSRYRLFPDESPPPEVLEDLTKRFDASPILAQYDEKQRRVALRGERTPFIQDDVLAEIGVDLDEFRLLYRLFSQHTHNGPIAFYRMAEHDRGTGVETRHEKRYLMVAIGFAAQFLARATNTQLDIVPDAETRPPHLTDKQVRMNVERNQGRATRR
ncbi:hypothetical protein MRBLMC3_001561 [Sphingobium sp. LMC3-1-1.1]|uniref:DUF5677 domain-containing protein n=1 Tax=Sphingobium sp. LMC3-1-1.1 TaxID=3135241 RepID=UPI0034157679